jgi:group II intron reverse transcriptase/maturase
MIEEVLHPANLMRAHRQVVSNKGSAGVDGMKVEELYEHFRTNRETIRQSLREGTYMPPPILGVEIPKSNGKVRLLGVPTVTDRMLQQAVGQILCNHYEMEFEDYSYGFRPNRNAQKAVLRALEHINTGHNWIVDMDLKSFFDEVDHCLLLQLLYRKVKCRMTLRLIRKWLRAPIQIKGKLVKRRKGVPQGSPLSPILSNIILNELDKEMERWGLKWIRYADDLSIYCTNEAQARKTGNYIYCFLRDRLKLPINREKSGIRRPEDFTTLGYSFEPSYKEEGKYHLTVSEKAWKSLKKKLKDITRKTTPYSFDTRVGKLKEVQGGWLEYFRLARIYNKLQRTDQWVRNRLRYCIWHNWKKPERKRKNLIRMGVTATNAYSWSRTRKGGWAVVHSPILMTTITLDRLHRRGYQAMLPIYKTIAPHLNEPLYTRPVRTVV